MFSERTLSILAPQFTAFKLFLNIVKYFFDPVGLESLSKIIIRWHIDLRFVNISGINALNGSVYFSI